MVCSGMIYSVFSFYLFQLGIPITQIGIIYTASAVSGLVFAPLFGKLSDKVGRKPIILLTILSFSFIFLFYSLSRTFMHVLPLQLLEGAMWAAFSAVTPALIADMADQSERGAYMGIYNQAWYTGWAIGPFLGGFLAESFGFQLSFLICSALLFISFILAMMFINEP